MEPTVLATIISSVITGLVALLVASIQHNKTAALMGYRLDVLEKKMDKHNQLQDRMIVQERDMKTAFSRIDELRSDVKEMEHKQ